MGRLLDFGFLQAGQPGATLSRDGRARVLAVRGVLVDPRWLERDREWAHRVQVALPPGRVPSALLVRLSPQSLHLLLGSVAEGLGLEGGGRSLVDVLSVQLGFPHF